jgi:hypothetical protein
MRFEEQTSIDETVFAKVRQIRETKGKEYATVEDTLADFKEVAEETGVSPLQVWNVYVKKHERAIDTFIREGSWKSESVYGRIIDVIVYHLLLLGLLQDLSSADVTDRVAGVDGNTSHGDPQTPIPLAHQGPEIEAE